MRKGIYRATAVKALDWNRLVSQLDGIDRLSVGIDVAKKVMFAALMTPGGEVLAVLKWTHLEESRWVTRQLAALPVPVEIAMEPSGTYGDTLRYCLEQAGLPVFRVAPKHVRDSREIYDAVPSNHDAKASSILAWLHLQQRSQRWPESEDLRRALGSFHDVLHLHSKALRHALNQLEALLARYWPELSQLLELDSATLLELVATFGSPARVARHGRQAWELMERVGGIGLKATKIDQVLASAGRSLGVPMLEEEVEALQQVATEARRLQQAVRETQNRLRRLAVQDASVRDVGAVVGLVTSSVLYSELGPLQAYPNAGCLLKAAGMNLTELSSGQRRGQRRLSKRGSGRARQYLFLAVLRWLHRDPWARAWHAAKVLRDGGNCKLKSVVALMRKLLQGLWWVARGEEFDSRKLFDIHRLEPTEA